MNWPIIMVHGALDGFTNPEHDQEQAARLLEANQERVHLYQWAETLDNSRFEHNWLTRRMKEHWRLEELGDMGDDAMAYLLDASTRTQAIRDFGRYLLNFDTPVIVLAHSLGSCLSWDTAKALSGHEVHLIMMGSPMAYKTVQALSWWHDSRQPNLERLDVVAGGLDPVAKFGQHWQHPGTHHPIPMLGHNLQDYLVEIQYLL